MTIPDDSAAQDSPTDRFPPPPAVAADPVATADLYERAAADRLGFWAETARERLDWDTAFTQVLDDSRAPFFRWFADGSLNACANAVDRHVAAGLGERVAFHFVGEPGDRESMTYGRLHEQVQRAANAMTELGVSAGDRVVLYLPNLLESVVAMLACARIGAPHSVVFSGFSPEALRARIEDAGATLVITADGANRRGAPAPLKPGVDAALAAGAPTVEHVLVVRRTGGDVDMVQGRDVWWHEALDAAPAEHEAQPFEAEHPLFILYTSGTTGKPKGILHTTGGYLTHVAATHRHVFDARPETDVFWCAADVGWVTGHSYIVYGPLLNAMTSVLYEGTPNTPREDRFWEIVEQLGVTTLYTAPTTIRTFMKWGEQLPRAHDLSSIRLLGSVGEPINPEAWRWYHRVIGGDRAPVMDTWWQTETGGIMVSALPGLTTLKPGSAQVPQPGVSVEVVDDEGNPLTGDTTGYLVLTQPWPGMLRGIWGDEERYVETYWSRFPGRYFAGDGAKRDADGDVWLLGRVDDVMNVSGHRISTTEVESALVSHPAVAEAAVVGAADETTGQGIVAFVILRADALEGMGDDADAAALPGQLRAHVSTQISPIARPRSVLVVEELPKTRSGKIMRRLLRDVAEDREVGDVTTLADSTVMDKIGAGMRAAPPEE